MTGSTRAKVFLSRYYWNHESLGPVNYLIQPNEEGEFMNGNDGERCYSLSKPVHLQRDALNRPQILYQKAIYFQFISYQSVRF